MDEEPARKYRPRKFRGRAKIGPPAESRQARRTIHKLRFEDFNNELKPFDPLEARNKCICVSNTSELYDSHSLTVILPMPSFLR